MTSGRWHAKNALLFVAVAIVMMLLFVNQVPVFLMRQVITQAIEQAQVYNFTSNFILPGLMRPNNGTEDIKPVHPPNKEDAFVMDLGGSDNSPFDAHQPVPERQDVQTTPLPLESGKGIINSRKLLDSLGLILEHKLHSVKLKRTVDLFAKGICNSTKTIANSCENGSCLRMSLPLAPRDRVAQLVSDRRLQLTGQHRKALQYMTRRLNDSYDILLLTAASSNHFLESQSMLKNLHNNVFPYLTNFTLVYYNLGLNSSERDLLVKFCRCQVLDFPFHLFPDFIQHLTCYSWKPLMIKAHITNANLVVWMDASIRIKDDFSAFQDLLSRARSRGVQIGVSSASTTFRTLRSMYHYFGDEPCMYLSMGQAKATFGIYHREPLVERAVLEPWSACALRKECMCPGNSSIAGCHDSKLVENAYRRSGGPIVYGLCHRFDQSAISLVLHKLYQEKYGWVMIGILGYVDIRRGLKEQYFSET